MQLYNNNKQHHPRHTKKKARLPFFTWVRVKLTIWTVALRVGKTPAQVRQDMQEVIDIAWEDPTSTAAAAQLRYFPGGKPTVETFMATLGQTLREDIFE